MSESNPSSAARLTSWLETLFREHGGAISFERFMAEALYHPEFGYYTRHIRTVGGSRGDFATSPTLSTLLGKAIACWIRCGAETLGPGSPRHVIEIGGGEGSLMAEVIAGLEGRCGGGWRRWFSRPGYRFHLVEISPRLRERQRETLGRRAGRRVTWHDTIESALEAAGGEALIYSNELVDAFPVIVLRRETATAPGEDSWSEVCVAFDPGTGLREVFRPLAETRPDLDRGDFAALRRGDAWPPGQRVELHASYRDWLRTWAPLWKRGAMLTIDYGSACSDEIYQRRPEGSLRAFFRHQRLTGAGIYRLFGKQDLTADVCFSDLETWGEALGWETVTRQSQADFLCEFAGAACGEAARTDRSAAFLFETDGAGEAFQVLSQRKP